MLKIIIKNFCWMTIGILITCYETSLQSIGISIVFAILFLIIEYDAIKLADQNKWLKNNVTQQEKQISFLHGRIDTIEKERDQFQEHTYRCKTTLPKQLRSSGGYEQ